MPWVSIHISILDMYIIYNTSARLCANACYHSEDVEISICISHHHSASGDVRSLHFHLHEHA